MLKWHNFLYINYIFTKNKCIRLKFVYLSGIFALILLGHICMHIFSEGVNYT